MSYQECNEEFQEWVGKHGYSNCQAVIKAWGRKRIDAGRPPRDKTKKVDIDRMYKRQDGLCAECNEVLNMAQRSSWEIDHIDPNAGENFNHIQNKRILCRTCNREKSAQTLQEQSKTTGRTMTEILSDGMDSPPKTTMDIAEVDE